MMNRPSVKLKLTQLKSAIKCPKKQRRTLEALGLKKINHQVEHLSSAQILGMIAKVKHLLQVEEKFK